MDGLLNPRDAGMVRIMAMVGHVQKNSILSVTSFWLMSRARQQPLSICVSFIGNDRIKFSWWAWLNIIENGGLELASYW